MIFVATKNCLEIFFPPPLLVLMLDPGSEIWDKHPGSATLATGLIDGFFIL
jgi:hypothetical protein